MRSLMICTHPVFSGGKIEKNEMAGMWHGGEKRSIEGFGGGT